MKSILFFTSILLFSLSSLAQEDAMNQEPVKKVETREFHGRVGQFIVDGLKAAGVKPVCTKNPNQTEERCAYQITNFYSAEETDGCGGGTTSNAAAFVHADGTKYEYRDCDGEGFEQRRRNAKPQAAKVDVTKDLQQILGELDMPKTEGWTGYIDAELIKCSTYGKDAGYTHCEIKGVFEY